MTRHVRPRCPKCDTRLTWRTHRCQPKPPAPSAPTVRTYDIPKLIAWIGSLPTSEIGPEQ